TMAAHTLGAGKTLCFAANARETLDMIALHRVDCLAAATQHVHDLIAEQRRQPVPLPTLRVVTAAGSLMSREMLRDARAALCPQIWVNYGSTEAACTAYASTDQLLADEGTVGFVCPWAEVEVLDDDGNAMPPGADGAYRIRADCMGRPYPSPQPGDSIRDGWFYPGDVGRVGANGMLIVSGRVSDIINVGGTKMAPELIEDVVRRHPAVADVAAVGMVGASGLEEIWLAVVRRGPLVADEIVALCAGVEIPVARVVAVAEIPRNLLAKIERSRIKAEMQTVAKG
ncbi:MAG: class I adenylate-forming enzyme family protein, partial [Stellaceae bacterium]